MKQTNKTTAKRNLSEKVRNSAKGMQYAYIMDCVKNSSRATDEGKEFADDAEVLQYFADCFGDEFNHEYNKRLYPNIAERIGNYLQGLPSVCSVDYWHYDIIQIGKKWGFCQTEKKAETFCDHWFTQLGCRIVEMCNKLGVQI